MRLARYFCSFLLLPFLSHPCPAQSQASFTPYDVEAAYLYNFGKFVEWPAAAGASSQPFSICILGQDNFGEKLNNLIAGETMQGREVAARRLASIADADNCQILFIGASETARLEKDLAVLETRPILTVSSLPSFLEHGGMIQFLLEDNRVRFAVNLPAARRTGLALSSELLKVAVYVTTKPTGKEQR